MNTDPSTNQNSYLDHSSKEVINSFFSNYGMEDSHHYLWQLFKLAFSGNLQDLTRKERDNIATFYKQLESLLTSLYNEGKPMKIP